MCSSDLIRSRKGVVIFWLLSLALVSLLALPLRSSLKTATGGSMITEKLASGLKIEVLTDLGPVLQSMSSFITTGLILLAVAGFIMNTFLVGGLFSTLKNVSSFSSKEFFKAGAENFWSFLVINIVVRMILNLIFFIFVLIPFFIMVNSGNISSDSLMVIFSVTGFVFLLLLPVILLIADNARAFYVSAEVRSLTKSLGFGFRGTFKTLRSSFPFIDRKSVV